MSDGSVIVVERRGDEQFAPIGGLADDLDERSRCLRCRDDRWWVPNDRIWGSVSWAEKRITIPSGSHVVRWSYTKDGSVATAADAGWIDQVRLL